MVKEEVGDYLEDSEEETSDEDADCYEVWPDNWETFTVFISLSARWQIDGMSGRYQGFLRADIESTLRLMQIESSRHLEIFQNLQVMEGAAMKELNRER